MTATEEKVEPAVETPASSRFDPVTWVVGACMALSAALSAVFIDRTGFDLNGQRTYTLFDDAMISMRYARNLAEGNGLVWNEGEKVEGYTNFLWTVYMAALHVLPVPDRLMSALVAVSGAVLLVLGVWLAARLARAVAPGMRYAPCVAALLTALSYPLIYWTLRGMEVGLLSVITTGSCLLALRYRDTSDRRLLWLVAALLSAAVLTRPDAVVIVAVVSVATALLATGVTRRSTAAVVIGIPLAVFVVHTLFRVGYYGELVPNTYTLKVSHIPLDVRIERGTGAMEALLLKGGVLMLVGGAAAAVAGFWGDKRVRKALALPAALVVALFAYSVYVGGDAWENLKFANRYTSTVLPLLFVLAAVGFEAVVRNVRRVAALVAAITAVTTYGLSSVTIEPIDGLYEPQGDVGRLFLAGLAVASLALVAGVASRRWQSELRVAAVMSLTALGLVALVSGASLNAWWKWMAPLEPGDRDTARYGVALKEMTEPGTRIAVSSAGNIAYFAGDERVFVDMLGKMDPEIANEEPRRVDFPPGHQKWNYDYTFFQLKPDLISQAFGLQQAETDRLVREGWTQIKDDAFVRPGATNVDGDAIRAFHEQIRRSHSPQ